MRLIDADALRKQFEDRSLEDFTHLHFIDAIDNAPTVNPYFPISEEVFYKITDAEWEHSNSFWVTTPSGKKVEFEKKRPQGDWIVTAEDNDGVHRICCPFCSYEQGSNNVDTIKVTFTKFPNFCENCGADMRKENNNEQTAD